MSEDNEKRFEQLREEVDPAQVELLKKEQGVSKCELDHNGDPRGTGPYPATNTLMIKFDDGMIPLHVCEVCAHSLHEEKSDWYLFICFGCMKTKWVHRKFIHGREYKEQIVGMNECPFCVTAIGRC